MHPVLSSAGVGTMKRSEKQHLTLYVQCMICLMFLLYTLDTFFLHLFCGMTPTVHVTHCPGNSHFLPSGETGQEDKISDQNFYGLYSNHFSTEH